MTTEEKMVMRRWSDWHLHVRDLDAMRSVVPYTVYNGCARAVIMPNLKPPVTTVEYAREYRKRILAAAPRGALFEPLMALYATDTLDRQTIMEMAKVPWMHGVKLYPAGATTNSAAGVTDIRKITAALEAMEEYGVPLMVHGEVTDPEVDIFDREKVFIETILSRLVAQFPKLRVVLEHITTQEGIAFVESSGDSVAGTITAHHLFLERNDLFVGGIRPHHYCLPVAKRRQHRDALRDALVRNTGKLFLGTDSAPHAKGTKEAACGCAGIFTAHAAIGLYAAVFEELGILHRLELFASEYGEQFYGYERNTGTITLVKEEQAVPEEYAFGEHVVVPFCAGGTVAWRVKQ